MTITTRMIEADDAAALTDEQVAELRPSKPRPDPEIYSKAVGVIDKLVNATAKMALEEDEIDLAMSLRGAWLAIITAMEHEQFDSIQMERELKGRIALLEEALAEATS